MQNSQKITQHDFLEKLKGGDVCYMQKKSAASRILFWWEIDKSDPTDLWFMNVLRSGNAKSNERPVFIVKPDLNAYIESLVKDGYNFYL